MLNYKNRLNVSAEESKYLEQFLKVNNYEDTVRQLDIYYGIVKRQLLRFQSPITGLFPVVSTDTEVGSIRDSIYCAAAVWGLYQAYRRIDDDRGKSYELGQSTVKCMRGILGCWTKQASRIEQFKTNQCNTYALHVKFHLFTGNEIFTDDEYHHLQMDVVSLYLLFLVQMIASGLQIIYTQDEVAFVQNLVYYVERAYRIPDYGMWERGSKYNDGTCEIHASSIGLAKAALEAINGCNLFGDKGASWSVVYVDIDAHNRNRSIFETLLPRESSSKEIDAALLPTISFPAFATHEDQLYSETKNRILSHLKGAYGFKRFNGDGYRTVLEDRSKRYYSRNELRCFSDVECQWPLFCLFMIIDGVFKSLPDQIDEYQQQLKRLIHLDANEDPVVPMLFYVPAAHLEEERRHPNSVERQHSDDNNGLFLWNQAMFILAQLLTAELLHINELDPIRRYLPSYNRPKRGGRYSAFQGTATDLVVQIVLIAESMRLQAMMATYGIQTQTPHEVEPVQIWSSTQLVQVYENLGVNRKLNLKGRPVRPIGSLGTSKIYRVCGSTVLCYPLIFEVSDFYLYRDMALLIEDIKTELQFVGRYWRLSGRPTVCLLIREDNMQDPQFKKMLDLLAMLKKGYCEGVKVRIGRLQNLISSSCIEHLDFMSVLDDVSPLEGQFSQFKQLEHDYIGFQSLTDVPRMLKYQDELMDYVSEYASKTTEEIVEAIQNIENLYGRCQLITIILMRNGSDFLIDGITVDHHLQKIYHQAGGLRQWATVRYASSALRHNVDSISPFITAVLVHGKQISVGVIGQKETVFDKPMTPAEIHTVVYNTIQPYDIIQAVLQQEIVLYCGRLIGTHPHLFRGILVIRVGWVVEAIKYYLSFESISRSIAEHSPYEVRQLLDKVLSIYDSDNIHERLTPMQRRQMEGCLCRVPDHFYHQVWEVLSRCPEGGIKVMDKCLAKEPIISTMVKSEVAFALRIEEMLNSVQDAAYRQLIVELLTILSTILTRNPEISFTHLKLGSSLSDGQMHLDLDQITREAMKMCIMEKKIDNGNMSLLLDMPYKQSTRYLARAVVNTVLKVGQLVGADQSTDPCKIS